jgi:replicative DNA helicase
VIAARPSMGKCLTGTAAIYDPIGGTRRPMSAVVHARERGEDVWVASLDRGLRLRPARVTRAHRNGIRPVFRLSTRLGRGIDATGNHPLLTPSGWRPLERLAPGHRIAVPRPLETPERPASVDDRQLAGIGARRGSGSGVLPDPGSSVLPGPGSGVLPGLRQPGVSGPVHSDVWWDEVASIDPIGERETFDLTVPDHHNFVADDVIVHNSTLATNIAENAAIEHGRPVALFSLEMSETELAHRFIASQARVSSDELRKGRVKADRWPKVLRAVEKLARAPIFIDDSSDISVLEMRAKARRLHSRHGGLGLIVVDYLQLVRPEGRTESRVEAVGQISRGLKILARELDIPVIAVSQLSRAVESRNPPIPMLSDLRESGQLEQDSDLVMFVYRDEYYDRESERLGEADIIVSKHRNGPIGQISLTFLPKYPRFANLYRERGTEAVLPQNGAG